MSDDPDEGGPAAARPPDSRRAGLLRAAAALVVVAGLVVVGRRFGGLIPQFALWVDGLGAWGPLAFIAGYAAATVAFVPGSLLTLAGGAIFGLARGTAYVFAGALVGASAAFLIARYLARGAVERRLESSTRFAAIDRAVESEGRKIVFLLRLSPVFPFNLLNYSLGLTRIRFGDYLLASIGMVPGTILYVYYGKLAGDVAALAGGAIERDAGYWWVLGAGLVATVAVTALVTRMARRALREAADV